MDEFYNCLPVGGFTIDMDKNPLGKLYTLRESLVAAETCTAHCNPNRVLILALDLLVLVRPSSDAELFMSRT